MLTKSKWVIAAMGLPIGLVGALTTAPLTQAQTPPPPQLIAAAINYRVIVDSTDARVLQQVRQVAPNAFIQSFADNRDRIQAGAFAGEISARNRVDALANVGVRAIAFDAQGQAIYQGSANGVRAFPNVTPPAQSGENPDAAVGANQMPKGYYAVVPVARDQIGITFEAFRKLGIAEEFITVGQQRRGWHLAVGVYESRTAAEKMSEYLRRKGGFDARSYYER